MNWDFAPDVQKEINLLAEKLSFTHINLTRVFCFRSFGSKSRAIARIWALPRIWQKALNVKPAYCLEIISEKFDKQTKENQKRTLIHELLHIPRNFSGTLLAHRRLKGKRFEELVGMLFKVK